MFNLLTVIELAGWAVLILTSVTQVVVPLWRGTPLFPILRSERKLEGELEEVHQQKIEADLQERIRRERRELLKSTKERRVSTTTTDTKSSGLSQHSEQDERKGER